MNKLLVLFFAFLAFLPWGAASAVDRQGGSIPPQFSVGNFFSASAAAAVKPSVEKRPGPRDAIGKELIDNNPTLEQVRLIPSLDGKQNKAVNDLFTTYRNDIKLLSDQLRALREEFKTRLKAVKKDNTGAVGAAQAVAQPNQPVPKEEEDPAIIVVVEQIKSRRAQFSQDLGKVVTDIQMKELDELKHGKVPAYAE